MAIFAHGSGSSRLSPRNRQVAARQEETVRAAGADLRHVSLNAPSLEDVYIHLTGRELRE